MRIRKFWILELSILLLILSTLNTFSMIGFPERKTSLKLRLAKKECKINGLKGLCMFVSDCLRSEGHHLGLCVDNLMFGSCCYRNVSNSSNASNANALHDYSRLPTLPPISIIHNETDSYTMKPFIKTTSIRTNANAGVLKRNVTVHSEPVTNKIVDVNHGFKSTIATTSTTTITPSTIISTTTVNQYTLITRKSTSLRNATRNYTIKLLSASASKKAECGKVPLILKPQMRIVGGKKSSLGQWPWQISVRRASFFGFSSVHRCGGALVNENWIITAAHCVDDLLTSQIRLRVGEHDFSNKDKRYPHIELGISRKVIHPKYNHSTYEYDLALLKLSRSIRYSQHINPICLPQTENDLVGLNATVTGWGRLQDGGILPDILHEAAVPIISNEKCRHMFLRSGRNEFIPDIFICAGHENGGSDSCQGDSGGPLQIKSPSDGRYFLVGVISWGIGCAEANMPGICTRISKFVPWILKNVI